MPEECTRRGRRVQPPEVRFWSKVNKDGPTMPHMDTPCWVWTAARNAKGYGHFDNTTAQRAAHLLARGPVPDGFTVDHLCRNRACVNPEHLEAVPHRINLLRGETVTARAVAATHCPNGHAYGAESVQGKRRVCRECERARSAAAYEPRGIHRRRRRKLTPAERERICAMVADGIPQSRIAKEMDVGQGTVSRVWRTP